MFRLDARLPRSLDSTLVPSLLIYGTECERVASPVLSITTGKEPACSLICRRPSQMLVLAVRSVRLFSNAIEFLLASLVFCQLLLRFVFYRSETWYMCSLHVGASERVQIGFGFAPRLRRIDRG
jgi:hypothetical protein